MYKESIMMKKDKIVAIIVMLFVTVVVIIYLNDDATKGGFSNKVITKEGFYFDTYVEISIYDCSENANALRDFDTILDEAIDICAKYEKICSPTNPNSELFLLNSNPDYLNGKTVELSTALEDIICKTEEITLPFQEKFSIYSGDLCALWDFSKKIIPSRDMIENALNNFNNPTVNTRITLGASAKGFIADKIGEHLRSVGINEALIDLGGNILAIGDKYNDSLYGIGIKKPFSDNSNPICAVKIKNKSVVTSGIYERYFEENNKIYHHIIDTSTGYPVENDILSVTIIADSSLVADCYSTGFLLMGKEFALNMANNKTYEDVECIIIDKDYNIYLSNGLKDDGEFITLK